MAARGAAPLPELPVYRPMTRCECAEMSFEDLARVKAASGWTLDELLERTGCGQTCTACRPDLEDFLRRGGAAPVR